MGLCGVGSSNVVEPDPATINTADKSIKKSLDSAQANDSAVVKLLLLGAGESGKSTIFKQMKVINQNGYTEEDRKTFQSVVWSNVVHSMRNLLGAFEKLGVEKPESIAADEARLEEATEDSERLTPELGELIKRVWVHSATQEVYSRRSEFQLNDSANWYLNTIERIAMPDYVPTIDDVLRSRVRTTGIVQSNFGIKGSNFRMYDVGGQRNERRKWIHTFDHVNAIVFVAALSEFDQNLYEDESQNRLEEAHDLFKQIVNSKWCVPGKARLDCSRALHKALHKGTTREHCTFKDTSIILFLNKKDLFEEKLKHKQFCEYPPGKGYVGPNTVEGCADFIKQKFLDLSSNADKAIWTKITTATDTTNIKHIFESVVAIIAQENMKAYDNMGGGL